MNSVGFSSTSADSTILALSTLGGRKKGIIKKENYYWYISLPSTEL